MATTYGTTLEILDGVTDWKIPETKVVVAQPSTSTSKPSTSTAKPRTSTTKPSTSTAKPSTSTAKPSASVGAGGYPITATDKNGNGIEDSLEDVTGDSTGTTTSDPNFNIKSN